MSLAVQDPPLVLGTGHGGMAARRAVVRWGWRLFRREWRQQSLVLALLMAAVAATTAGLGAAANTSTSQASTFGTADHLVTLSSTGAQQNAFTSEPVALVHPAISAIAFEMLPPPRW